MDFTKNYSDKGMKKEKKSPGKRRCALMTQAGFKKITRRDVAREAGVTETIVSYVLNNNRYVNADKRKRVLAAVEKLGYKPNTAARALKGKSLNHIVFIADQIVTEHFSLLLSEMDKRAYDLGYMISLCQNRNTEDFVNSIISRQFDGVIISSISFSKGYIRQLIKAGIPVVLIENRDYSDVENAGKINNGLYEGAREVVKYLASIGRKEIVYIDRFSQNGHFSDMSDMRYRGYVHEMTAEGLAEEPEKRVISGCGSPEDIAERVRTYLLEHPKTDAIFGRNDRVACVAMQAAQKMGRCVPEDLAVVGFDNSLLGQYSTPSISSVEIRRDLIAADAIDMLQSMIESKIIPEKSAYPTRLIRRESTNVHR